MSWSYCVLDGGREGEGGREGREREVREWEWRRDGQALLMCWDGGCVTCKVYIFISTK